MVKLLAVVAAVLVVVAGLAGVAVWRAGRNMQHGVESVSVPRETFCTTVKVRPSRLIKDLREHPENAKLLAAAAQGSWGSDPAYRVDAELVTGYMRSLADSPSALESPDVAAAVARLDLELSVRCHLP